MTSGQIDISTKELGELLGIMEGWLKVAQQAIKQLPPDTTMRIAAGTTPGKLIRGASDPEIRC